MRRCSATFGHRSAEQRRKAGFGRGYVLRRYGVLRSQAAALRGRLAGWRAAGRGPRRPLPAPDAIDRTITFADSLRLRRGVYRGHVAAP